MRRTLASWVVVLCLVVTQMGALAHEVGHLSDGRAGGAQAGPGPLGAHRSTEGDAADGKPADEGKSSGVDKLCKLCGAFAQIGAGLRSGSSAPLLLALAEHHCPEYASRLSAAELVRAHCRGPPFRV